MVTDCPKAVNALLEYGLYMALKRIENAAREIYDVPDEKLPQAIEAKAACLVQEKDLFRECKFLSLIDDTTVETERCIRALERNYRSSGYFWDLRDAIVKELHSDTGKDMPRLQIVRDCLNRKSPTIRYISLQLFLKTMEYLADIRLAANHPQQNRI